MNPPFKIDFIGIGASKAGTTWLGLMLEDHPQLCMSVPKEAHYFNDLLTYRNRIMEKNYQKGISWYKMHFKHCDPGKLKGEITPRYCEDPVAPGRIKEHNPEIKILYCLRSPVDRIESHYNFARYYVGKEDRPMEKAVMDEPEFIRTSKYYQNLSMYLRHFDRERIFLIWFEDIKERPAELLHEVYTFLGVNPTYLPKHMHEKSNPGRVSKSFWLKDATRKINHKLIALGMSGLVKRLKKAGLGNLMMKVNSKPLQKEKITPALKAWIIDQVRDDVHKLEQFSGKDLSHWLE